MLFEAFPANSKSISLQIYIYFKLSPFGKKGIGHAVYYLMYIKNQIMYGCESWTIKKAEHQKEVTLLNYGAGEDS